MAEETERSFDLQSWQGLTELLKVARESTVLSPTEYAAFRNIVLEYSQKKGTDQALKKRIDAVIEKLHTPPKKESGEEKKKHDTHGRRVVPSFAVVPEIPKKKPAHHKEERPTPPPPPPAPAPEPEPMKEVAPPPLPVVEEVVQVPPPSPAPTTEARHVVPAPPEVHRTRITEIKRHINSLVGNPVSLVDHGNHIGRDYMTALLGALKATSPGSTMNAESAMQVLEDAYAAILVKISGGVGGSSEVETPSQPAQPEQVSEPQREPESSPVPEPSPSFIPEPPPEPVPEPVYVPPPPPAPEPEPEPLPPPPPPVPEPVYVPPPPPPEPLPPPPEPVPDPVYVPPPPPIPEPEPVPIPEPTYVPPPPPPRAPEPVPEPEPEPEPLPPPPPPVPEPVYVPPPPPPPAPEPEPEPVLSPEVHTVEVEDREDDMSEAFRPLTPSPTPKEDTETNQVEGPSLQDKLRARIEALKQAKERDRESVGEHAAEAPHSREVPLKKEEGNADEALKKKIASLREELKKKKESHARTESALPRKTVIPSVIDIEESPETALGTHSRDIAESPHSDHDTAKTAHWNLNAENGMGNDDVDLKALTRRPTSSNTGITLGTPQAELASPAVTMALTELLHEWNIFASSGLFGMGPGGVEHPLYIRLSKLPMGEVVMGRFEDADPKVIRSIKDYVDAWRHEQGVAYNATETFEHYLRRVAQRILKRQNGIR